jgi:hypothetical protein
MECCSYGQRSNLTHTHLDMTSLCISARLVGGDGLTHKKIVSSNKDITEGILLSVERKRGRVTKLISMELGTQRWAVNSQTWTPSDSQFAEFVDLLPIPERPLVLRLVASNILLQTIPLGCGMLYLTLFAGCFAITVLFCLGNWINT